MLFLASSWQFNALASAEEKLRIKEGITKLLNSIVASDNLPALNKFATLIQNYFEGKFIEFEAALQARIQVLVRGSQIVEEEELRALIVEMPDCQSKKEMLAAFQEQFVKQARKLNPANDRVKLLKLYSVATAELAGTEYVGEIAKMIDEAYRLYLPLTKSYKQARQAIDDLNRAGYWNGSAMSLADRRYFESVVSHLDHLPSKKTVEKFYFQVLKDGYLSDKEVTSFKAKMIERLLDLHISQTHGT